MAEAWGQLMQLVVGNAQPRGQNAKRTEDRHRCVLEVGLRDVGTKSYSASTGRFPRLDGSSRSLLLSISSLEVRFRKRIQKLVVLPYQCSDVAKA